jgi:hypothetical protein
MGRKNIGGTVMGARYDMTITEIVARLEHIHTIAMDLKESKKVYSKIDALLYDIEESRIKEDEEHGE